MNIQNAIKNIALKSSERETGFIYDIFSNTIVWRGTGDEDNINILSFAKTHDCKNLVFVHSHPLNEFVGTYPEWHPLSPQDVWNTAHFNFAGVIANDGENLYSIFRPKNGWGKIRQISSAKFFNVWQPELKKLEKADKEKVKNLRMEIDDYYHEALVKRWYNLFRDVFALEMEWTKTRKPTFHNALGFDFIAPEDIPAWMKSSPKLMEKLSQDWESAKQKLSHMGVLKSHRTRVPRKTVRVNVRAMF